MKILKLLPKYLPWILLIVGGIAFFKYYDFASGKNKKLETYNRQLSGNLNSSEHELQNANNELGILRSKLLSEQGVSDYWKKSKDATDKKFNDFIKKHNLKIKSLDNTIAQLKQKIENGSSDIEISENCNIGEECVISYVWQDKDGRFSLKDPNIFKHNNEIFESNQIFVIRGTVAEQKNGSLQIRRITLSEVVKDENGKYIQIEGANAHIVESDFKYSNPPTIDTEWEWTDLFRLRAVALGSVTAFPDDIRLRFGLGVSFFEWEGFGINSHTAFDFNDIKKWEQRIGITYTPNFFDDFKLNVGLGVSIGTPFANIFQDYSINIDLI